ncbi:hypothetical protein PoB_000528400 [Plakobranchus ocellatus]|uniref:Uncharacterized protein n=1 Tax=Plakobranchus ocellatus TaxID=259542 RepID=A0AAV3Y780_9GAST|nr:hypothetical protein PoB_000528400 [Plakobranchus ocellatus]
MTTLKGQGPLKSVIRVSDSSFPIFYFSAYPYGHDKYVETSSTSQLCLSSSGIPISRFSARYHQHHLDSVLFMEKKKKTCQLKVDVLASGPLHVRLCITAYQHLKPLVVSTCNGGSSHWEGFWYTRLFDCNHSDTFESGDIPLIAFKTSKDFIRSKRKGKEQNKETPSSPTDICSSKQKTKKLLANILQRQSPSPKIIGHISDSDVDDDVDYTRRKPKKPKQHKYWVQNTTEGLESVNEVTAFIPVMHSGCNEPETLQITDTVLNIAKRKRNKGEGMLIKSGNRLNLG